MGVENVGGAGWSKWGAYYMGEVRTPLGVCDILLVAALENSNLEDNYKNFWMEDGLNLLKAFKKVSDHVILYLCTQTFLCNV